MIATIRTFEFLQPMPGRQVLDEYWTIIYNINYYREYPVGGFKYITLNTYQTGDGTSYAEVRRIWESVDLFNQWCNNSQLQADRLVYETEIVRQLALKFNTISYADPLVLEWADPTKQIHRPMAEYVAPSSELILVESIII